MGQVDLLETPARTRMESARKLNGPALEPLRPAGPDPAAIRFIQHQNENRSFRPKTLHLGAFPTGGSLTFCSHEGVLKVTS
jgi:hypothetical protein